MDKLRYLSTETYLEGYIVGVHGSGVTIDLKGRMGQLKIPLRMLICDEPIQEGQTVGFVMSYPEVLPEEDEAEESNEAGTNE